MPSLKRFIPRAAACLLFIYHGAALADAGTDGVTQAQRAVDQHRTAPSFVPPGASFDAKTCGAANKLLAIPNNSANPFLKGIIDRMIRAKADSGLEVVEWQNQGQPSQWVQGMEFASKNRFTGISLVSGIDPKTIEPQIRAAKAAGIKTMVSHFYDPSQPADPIVSSSVAVRFNEVGHLLADWAIVKTAGKASIVIVKSDDVPPTEPLVRGITDELAARCPDCKIIQQINVGVTEWGTKIQQSVQAALLAHPEVNYVIPIYDSMSQFVVPALTLTGRAATTKIATFNGTPFVLDFVRQGKVEMDIGESIDWIAHATLDAHLRDFCGLPVPAELNVPFYIFDASNVATAGIPATFDQGYGEGYLLGFRALWKVSP